MATSMRKDTIERIHEGCLCITMIKYYRSRTVSDVSRVSSRTSEVIAQQAPGVQERQKTTAICQGKKNTSTSKRKVKVVYRAADYNAARPSGEIPLSTRMPPRTACILTG